MSTAQQHDLNSHVCLMNYGRIKIDKNRTEFYSLCVTVKVQYANYKPSKSISHGEISQCGLALTT